MLGEEYFEIIPSVKPMIEMSSGIFNLTYWQFDCGYSKKFIYGKNGVKSIDFN
jgi:hypothetical protein